VAQVMLQKRVYVANAAKRQSSKGLCWVAWDRFQLCS